MAKSKNRPSTEINASSMADIAFLLLIFFLVTTRMAVDKGISVVLPPWSDEPPPETELQDRNAFIVVVNSHDDLLVENEITDIKDLKNKAKRFINNKGEDPTLSDNPQIAVISFRGDRGTSYERYIGVYNELLAAYNELRDEYSNGTYGSIYNDLDSADRAVVKKMYPLRISEAEPLDYGEH